MITELILANLAIALASAVQASAGLGFMMVGSPLVGLINLTYIPGSLLVANMALSTTMIAQERSAIDRRELPPLAVGLALGTLLGALILTRVPTEHLGVLIGSFILAAVALSAVTPRAALTTGNILLSAGAAGLSGIVAGMHAPPLIVLYQREAPAKVRATFSTVFVFGSILALAGLWFAGRFGQREILLGLGLLPGVLVGYGFGRILAGKISQSTARIAMLTISGLSGAVLVVKSL